MSSAHVDVARPGRRGAVGWRKLVGLLRVAQFEERVEEFFDRSMKGRVNNKRSVVASLVGQSQDTVMLSAGFEVTGTVRGAKAEKGALTNAVAACPSE